MVFKRLPTCSALFDSTLLDKVPVYKVETEAFLTVSDTVHRPVLGVGTDLSISSALSSSRSAGARLKPLLAVAAGMGRSKTRKLVEVQRELSRKPSVLCLALTLSRCLFSKYYYYSSILVLLQ